MANEKITVDIPQEVLTKVFAESIRGLAVSLGVESEFEVQLQFLKDTLQIKENREVGSGAPLALAIIYAGSILQLGDDL